MAESETKSDKADEGVLANLSATRPSRLSRRARADGNGDGEAGAPAKPAPAKAKPKAKPKAPAKAGPARRPAQQPPLAEAPKSPRPRPVRPGAPQLSEPVAKAGENREPATASHVPSGAELVATVVKATGELASIGATVAGQILKRAVEKLPRR